MMSFSFGPLRSPDGGGCGGGGCGCHASRQKDSAEDHHHHEHGHGHEHNHHHGGGAWWQSASARLAGLSAIALAIAWGVSAAVPAWEQIAFALATLIPGAPVARHAVQGLRRGQWMSIEFLMTIAAVGAVSIGAAQEAAAVVFLFQIGEVLEGLAAHKAQAGLAALIRLTPATAQREAADGLVETVPADQLHPGDTILLRPGDRVPADGIVLSGTSSLDESLLTGESLPLPKSVNSAVLAGTIVVDGTLKVRVTTESDQTTLARIVRLVKNAQSQKAPIARFTERFASLYTPLIVAIAAITAVAPPLLAGEDWQTWIYRSLAVLLIGCPCALVISTPAAIAAGLSVGARNGLLIKSGATLEALGQVSTVAFDKTGTLTQGRPSLASSQSWQIEVSQALTLAASLGQASSHPVSQALVTAAKEQNLPLSTVDNAVVIPGQGVRGQIIRNGAKPQELFLGGVSAVTQLWPALTLPSAIADMQQKGASVSLLLCDHRLIAAFAVTDTMRPDAADALSELRALHVSAFMITGDHAAAAQPIAQALGIPAHADLLPADKLSLVQEQQKNGQVVAKVGDGINDAPALAAAHVGIAMGGGTDVALETADAASLHGRVRDIPAMIRLSRRTLRTIHQNVALALGLKGAFLVLTVLGITGLWPAVLADSGATVLVTANALRLLRARLSP